MKHEFTIICDTREKLPFSFSSKAEVIHCALPAGDYSLAGHEGIVAVERKSLNDLVNSLIQERGRFFREVEKLARYPFACVVVEACLTDVLTHRYYSAAYPSSIIGSVLKIIIEHKVPVFFCGDRHTAQLFTERYLLRCLNSLEVMNQEGDKQNEEC